LGATIVELEAAAPRVRCRAHGVVVAAVPWARPGSRFTRPFEDQVAWLAAHCSASAVAELMGVAWRSVTSVIERVVADALGSRDLLAGMTRVGIDELAYRKGQRYLLAVTDHATGRLLAALARVDAELPISTLASVAGVGRTRASGLISELSGLGLVDRREIGRTTMVRLARDNAVGSLVDRLGHLQSVVTDQLRLMAAEMDPAPLALVVFGSFARGEANVDSDIDVLAVRPGDADSDRWADALATFATNARRLTGNPVQILEYDLAEFRRRASPRAKTGRAFWEALRRDGVILAGASVDELVSGRHVASR